MYADAVLAAVMQAEMLATTPSSNPRWIACISRYVRQFPLFIYLFIYTFFSDAVAQIKLY
jgi:hypothetical protein